MEEIAGTFYVDPRKSPDLAWAFASRFMFVLAYAFVATYRPYYLLDKIGSAEADVAQQLFLSTLAQSVVVVARNFNSFLVGMAISGLGFGMSTAVDLAGWPTCGRQGPFRAAEARPARVHSAA